ncbi:MAG: GreA/GreB family elongation factor, partial [Alphaproteobacteria bacterium]
VTLLDEDTGETVTYQVVGSDESNIKQGFLSITSPLARALIGKSVSDSIEVITPNGSKAYSIKKIEFI